MSLIADFRTKYNVHNLSIFATEYWALSVRPQQVTFGSLLLSSNQKNNISYSDLNVEALQDLQNVYGYLNKLKLRLKSEQINYYSLMMIDRHLHSHVFFRYKSPFTLGHNIYTDDSFPGLLDLDCTLNVNPFEVKSTILDLLL